MADGLTSGPVTPGPDRDCEATDTPLAPAARRALAEAAARRTERDAAAAVQPPERHGRGGLDPVRYDDWEIGGLAVDF